ncbi:hypothetical protein L1887_36576 [Cichorium endivia]|nr:hypothetical protein L1887_36576 [Cichorium endivia]
MIPVQHLKSSVGNEVGVGFVKRIITRFLATSSISSGSCQVSCISSRLLRVCGESSSRLCDFLVPSTQLLPQDTSLSVAHYVAEKGKIFLAILFLFHRSGTGMAKRSIGFKDSFTLPNFLCFYFLYFCTNDFDLLLSAKVRNMGGQWTPPLRFLFALISTLCLN